MQIAHPPTLKALIKQRGLSYAALGREVGCAKQFIGHLAVGHKTGATPELAERIAEALSVPLEVIFVPGESTNSGQTDHSEKIAS